MAWNKEHKQHSHDRILSAAAELFVQKGFDAIGIDQVMAKAGMTRGAFYSHFQSKTDLYQQAMVRAATDLFRQRQSPEQAIDPRRLAQDYLSDQHIQSEELGCPLAFLVTDVAQQQPEVRDTYSQLFERMADRLSTSGLHQRESILANMVMMIGGVAVARALASAPELQREVLEAVRNSIGKETT